jgi:hypothetical protein
MQANRGVAGENRRGDQAHTTAFADSGSPDFDIKRKSGQLAYRVGSQAFESRPGILGIMSNRLITSHRDAALEPEQVIDSSRPNQRLVGKIALPQSGMMRLDRSEVSWAQRIGDRAVEDVAELKTAVLFPKRPIAARSIVVQVHRDPEGRLSSGSAVHTLMAPSLRLPLTLRQLQTSGEFPTCSK